MTFRSSTTQTHLADGSLTRSEVERRQREQLDATPLVARCAFCEWTWQGSLADCRQQAVEHRQTAHPGLKPPKRRSRSQKLAHRAGTDEERREASLLRQAARAEREPHGTRGRYALGCTCLPCTDAWTSYHRAHGAA